MPRCSHSREKWYDILIEEEGGHCKICGRSLPDVYLEVDHKDGNPKHDVRSNVQLLCRSCNRKKNPRGKARRNAHPFNYKASEKPRISTAEFQTNKRAEPLFRKWLLAMVKKHRRIPTEDAINGGAEYAGCSQITCRRYLQKLCSITGAFREVYDPTLDKKVIEFKNGESVGITTDLISE